MTAVAGSSFSAASFNQMVRDNLNETAPAKATTAGRWFISTGLNSIAERAIENAGVLTSETTTSTSYVDLATPGPTVTLTTGTRAIVILTAHLSNNTANQYAAMSYAVSGASTIAASHDVSLTNEPSTGLNVLRASAVNVETGLTAGSNVFTSKYRVQAGTGTFLRRQITVMAL